MSRPRGAPLCPPPPTTHHWYQWCHHHAPRTHARTAHGTREPRAATTLPRAPSLSPTCASTAALARSSSLVSAPCPRQPPHERASAWCRAAAFQSQRRQRVRAHSVDVPALVRISQSFSGRGAHRPAHSRATLTLATRRHCDRERARMAVDVRRHNSTAHTHSPTVGSLAAFAQSVGVHLGLVVWDVSKSVSPRTGMCDVSFVSRSTSAPAGIARG